MIYLDNSATTRTMGVAAEAAKKYMTEEFFNPAAAYSPAVREERAVNGARKTIGSAINAGPDEIIFTSGGTESNNMAILGSLKAMRGRGRIIVGSTEHPSVYEVYKSLACQYDVVEAPVDNTGMIDLKRLESLITPDTRLVSVMQVNNEVGAVNDAETIRRILRRRAPEALLHVDGVQGFLKVPFDAKNCDLYSISGHKIHAPKGTGVLYLRQGTKFAGGQIGGGQEKNMRSGTTNTPGIMGMDAAVRNYLDNIDEYRCAMRSCNAPCEKPYRAAGRAAQRPRTGAGCPTYTKRLVYGRPRRGAAARSGGEGDICIHRLRLLCPQKGQEPDTQRHGCNWR